MTFVKHHGRVADGRAVVRSMLAGVAIARPMPDDESLASLGFGVVFLTRLLQDQE